MRIGDGQSWRSCISWKYLDELVGGVVGEPSQRDGRTTGDDEDFVASADDAAGGGLAAFGDRHGQIRLEGQFVAHRCRGVSRSEVVIRGEPFRVQVARGDSGPVRPGTSMCMSWNV